ncbi:MAG: UvrD-helicase domain-containing protein [Clostridia bacterium]|nr:UvrD-helicase domain-containing protein [Clostridia bacterium]
MDDILGSLNEDQIKPVMDTEGRVLVLAGAGSGKTRVLTSRIAYILEKGLAHPSQILAITFTNKAAGEMRDRINVMVDNSSEMWISTIHSMCSKILRSNGKAIGIEPNFSIYSEVERANVIKKVIKEKNLGEDKVFKSARDSIASAKSLGIDPESYFGLHRYERNMRTICDVFEAYEEHLKHNNSLDFDDLLIKTRQLLTEDAETLAFLSDKFKYVLVDEFQDTNAIQYEIIKLLSSRHGNLFAVGDDDQSIYGWRGAEIGNILDFDKDFPDAKIYKLQRNYRSSSSILDLANVIIKNNASRRPKTLWTQRGPETPPEYYEADEESEEAMYVARTILDEKRRRGCSYSDFAVLMRMNSLTRSFEQEFTKYAIPFKVFGGFRFFERKEVKDLLAYMRLISNPFDDEAFMRIVNIPRRGIGEKTLETIEAFAAAGDTNLYFASLNADKLDITHSAKQKLSAFADFIRDMVLYSQTETVIGLVNKMTEATGIRKYYLDGTEEGDTRAANVDEFVASVEEFSRLNPTATLDDYLNQVTLSTTTDDMDEGEYVTVATIHAVKGLEFDEVFISGLEEGVMPISRASDDVDIEEERRLMYVAVTRAKSRLYLTRSCSRYMYGSREPTAMSMFLDEAREVMGNRIPRTKGIFPSRGARRGVESDYEKFGFAPDAESSYDAPIPSKSGKNITFGVKTGPAPDKSGVYSVGMRVEHKKYGEGQVVGLLKDGRAILVKFKTGNIMELSAAIAPLTIISEE